MARKAVLEGGKRDEIILTAMKLFFENGYEATSVRMIMNQVGGEIGMFYHYFKSKEELFDKVVERFFKDYRERFEALIQTCNTPEEFVDAFIPMYSESMRQFNILKGNIHWTVQYAMSAGTIASIKPAVVELLERWNVKSDTSMEILAGQILYGVSATIHSNDFEAMDPDDKRKSLITFINKLVFVNMDKE